MAFGDQEPGAASQREEHSPEAIASQKRFEAKVAAQDKADVVEQQARQQDAAKQAEFDAHPHTRLTALAADLGTKRVDLHDRIGAIQRVLAGFIGVALQHTPAPHREDHHDEKRNDAVGPEGQGPTGG